jgi:hypothetical protein
MTTRLRKLLATAVATAALALAFPTPPAHANCPDGTNWDSIRQMCV